MQVSIEEAQANLPELARRVRSGGEVVITKDGQPYIRLMADDGTLPAAPRCLDAYQGAMSPESVDALLAPFTKEEVLRLFWDGGTE